MTTTAAASRVVVVGGGIAGLTAALHAAQSGSRVTLLTKTALGEANTRYAQGGIAAVMFDDDAAESHIADTLRAGAGLSDAEAVRVLVEEGPERIRELIARGVQFDRDAAGVLRTGLEAAHSYPRVLHAGGDATGAEIERALVQTLRAAGTTVIERAFATDLVVRGGRVAGVAWVRDGGEPQSIEADAVILATGGAGQLYAWTTNPDIATGDGIALALRSGAAVRGLEFVQFHPTIVAVGEPFLISEAVRGEGALLRDAGGNPVVDHPDGELAPRDIVARAIARRIREHQGAPVVLDATGLAEREGAGFFAHRFPTIATALAERGIDPDTEPIPVAPAAHYLMGGITTDLWGRASVPGLYAVGECASTGVHGANRLASNSLLEGAVFGARAGDAVAADVRALAAGEAWPARGLNDERTDASGTAATAGEPNPEASTPLPPFSRRALQSLLWEYAGLERSGAGLAHATRTLAAWSAEPPPAHPTIAEREDANLLLIATALVQAATARTGSVGAHFRVDDPATPAAPRAAVVSKPAPTKEPALTKEAAQC